MKKLYDDFLEFFRIEEIVSPQCFSKYKKHGDYFFLSRFDPRLLETMLVIRTTLKRSITVNDWIWGGRFDERGLRDTSTPMVKNRAIKSDPWLSAHVLGKAFDFDVKGMTAKEVREWLVNNQEILPHRIRLENLMKGNPISWVHLDVCDDPKNPKVYLFNI